MRANVLFLALIAIIINKVNGSELSMVIVHFRHGDRTPISPYANDPHKNASEWPVNYGQLTNRGKMQEV